MSDSLTLYKLIILFMLDKVDFPLTTSQISEFILEKEYTNYFTIQQALNELTDSHLVRADTMRGTTYYQNTDEGKNTVTYFGDRIPQAIVDDIMSYLDQNRYTLKKRGVHSGRLLPGHLPGFCRALSGKRRRSEPHRPDAHRAGRADRCCHLQQLA